jgi:2-oxoglutarate dehydrogenase E1 component
MPTEPVTSVFNDGYIADLYDAYRRDPDSVDESWRQFFRVAERIGGSSGGEGSDPALLKKAAGAGAFMQALRTYGHFAVPLDPLGTPPLGAPELTPEFHGITEGDLDSIPGSAVGFPHMATAADVARRLRLRYTTSLGFQVTHLADEAERKWFREILTAEELTRPLTPDEKRGVLKRLTEVDGLERFLGRAYPNAKRFGIEGTDALVPMLDMTIAEGAAVGATHVVLAMAHRGRLNVLAHILNKPYATIFEEFEQKHGSDEDPDATTGDVKYHLGAHVARPTGGKVVDVTLLPNPSHLEVVNPVLEGVARALERDGKQEDGEPKRDELRVIPVCVHGDAAFPGEGIVPETFNLSRLPGYRVGGTVHIIVNNQIGFTTDPIDARSTHYASDVAKGFDVPIVHVNADNAEACVIAIRIAIAYRTRFHKDFLIDLVGYRRHGHNEGDEPTFTQPTIYERIKSHPTPRVLWGERIVREGVVSADDVAAMERELMDRLTQIHAQVTAGTALADAHEHVFPGLTRPTSAETSVPRERLTALNDRLMTWPPELTIHPRLARQLTRRRDALGPGANIDWGEAEALAFASLLTDGTSVRLTGQDAERGTFSHRHAVLHDTKSGARYTPLQHLPGAGGFEIYNSPLSETAVLGFEYGYAAAAPDSLVLWEAQYGDFVNVAQPIIDQFLAADRAKWGEGSGVVLLLPHGYEGGGPEHSSARLERFLQLAAEGNMVIAYPSTAGQYFHVLRRQAMTALRRPLVLMQPKSLLRLDRAASTVDDLTAGRFQPTFDDPVIVSDPARRQSVRRVVFCTGKIYYDLTASGARPPQVAIVRVEELYPWPLEEVAHTVDLYPQVEEVAWVQEEPKNMGAWTFVAPRLRAATGNALAVRYIGRPERASPAEGYQASHQREQARIVADALAAVDGGSPATDTRGRRDVVSGSV